VLQGRHLLLCLLPATSGSWHLHFVWEFEGCFAWCPAETENRQGRLFLVAGWLQGCDHYWLLLSVLVGQECDNLHCTTVVYERVGARQHYCDGGQPFLRKYWNLRPWQQVT
jgi:hypothetical protein